jgi:hypothetical protein
LVQSIRSNASGRDKIKALECAKGEADQAIQIALKVGNIVSIWKTRREMVHLFCAMERFNDAEAQLAILRDTHSQLPQSDDLKLDLRGCEDLCDFSRATLKDNHYNKDKLEEIQARLREEVEQLKELSVHDNKFFERLEKTNGDLAITSLTLMEALGPYQSEDKMKCEKGEKLGKEARRLYSGISKQRKARYQAEAREYEDHKHIIDADLNIVIACLRFGFWKSDEVILEDAAGSLQKILMKYEKVNLETSNTDVRRTAYWLQRAWNYLGKLKEAAEYENDLAMLQEKYNLVDAVARSLNGYVDIELGSG